MAYMADNSVLYRDINSPRGDGTVEGARAGFDQRRPQGAIEIGGGTVVGWEIVRRAGDGRDHPGTLKPPALIRG